MECSSPSRISDSAVVQRSQPSSSAFLSGGLQRERRAGSNHRVHILRQNIIARTSIIPGEWRRGKNRSDSRGAVCVAVSFNCGLDNIRGEAERELIARFLVSC